MSRNSSFQQFSSINLSCCCLCCLHPVVRNLHLPHRDGVLCVFLCYISNESLCVMWHRVKVNFFPLAVRFVFAFCIWCFIMDIRNPLASAWKWCLYHWAVPHCHEFGVLLWSVLCSKLTYVLYSSFLWISVGTGCPPIPSICLIPISLKWVSCRQHEFSLVFHGWLLNPSTLESLFFTWNI